ncbi:hypothetical protein [Mesorhizobium loti]|uniref:hypothetical protein n=1 Tax=Rhizobium loti TaxID=381 RepID=UPI0004293BB6|nr:hypothetical protein [Mesorhizobium loti]
MLDKIIDALNAVRQNVAAHDIAAGVSENLLNSYSKAHHHLEHPKKTNVYKGSGDLPDLRLGYGYDIMKPGVFDLSPNPHFDREMSRWLLVQPEILQHRSTESVRILATTPQPNLKLTIPQVDLKFELKTLGKEITISFSLTVLCFVTTDSASQLRIVPTSARIDDPVALENDVKSAAKAAGIPLGKIDSTCYELWELVKYIVNNVLAARIADFVKSIPLPSFINVFQGFNFGNLNVAVMENYVVATATISGKRSIIRDEDVFDNVSSSEQADVLQTIAEDAFAKATRGSEEMNIRDADDVRKLPGGGFFLLLTQNLFQKLADKFLNINDSSEQCSSFLGFVDGCVGWAVRVWNPKVSLRAPNMLVDVDFSAEAYVQARAHLHCVTTPWLKAGVKGEPVPQPAKLTTTFYGRGGNTVWMSAGPRPFAINWLPEDYGWPLTLIIAALLDILTNVAVNLCALLGIKWTIKLADIPTLIPGTGVTARPRIDNSMTNYNGDLAITGDVDFS